MRCPACEGSRSRVLLEVTGVPVFCNVVFHTPEEATNVVRGDIRLVRCPDCGMIWNADFDPALMSYEGDYENSLHGSAIFREYAEQQATRLIDTYDIRDGDVIEIGSGRGEFLELVCDLGENRGVGYDPSAAPLHASTHGAMRLVRAAYSLDARDRPVDLLVCRHVLEHVGDPARFLMSIREVLGERTDTVIFFEVPDARWMLEQAAVWDLLYEHCSYFGEPALTTVIERSEYDVCRVGREFGGQFLTVDARPARSRVGALSAPHEAGSADRSATGFAQRRREVVDSWERRLAMWRADGRRIALWGAGTKGVMFLNTVQGAGEIDAVVDVNPRKQGAHVAGTGQPILGPNGLADQVVDIVVVLNPRYGDEIAAALLERGLNAEVVVDDDAGRIVGVARSGGAIAVGRQP